MKRKVIQIANSTQLISLPRKWALAHNIKKGEELDVNPDGNKLVISTNASQVLEKYRLTFDKKTGYLRRPLSTLYKLGYDEVEITFTEPSMIENIKQQTDELLGFEIIHQTSRSCIIKNVASAMDTEFDNILRRTFLILLSLAKESYDAIKKKKFDFLAGISELEKTNNKLTFFCERVLNKHGYRDQKKQAMTYAMIFTLEQVADSFAYICKYLSQAKSPNLSADILQAYKTTVELVDHFYKNFYNFSFDKLVTFKEQKIAAENTCYKVMKKMGSQDDVIIAHHLLALLDRLHHATECLI